MTQRQDVLEPRHDAARRALALTRQNLLTVTLEKFRAPRADAAKRALDLIAELERTVDEIDAMSAELRRMGGSPPDLSAHKTLEYLAVRLRPLAAT